MKCPCGDNMPFGDFHSRCQWDFRRQSKSTRTAFPKLIYRLFLLVGIMNLLISSAESAQPPAALKILSGKDFSGGAQHLYGGSFFGRSAVNYVYSQATSVSQMEAEFELSEIPDTPLFLHLTAADDDVAGVCEIELSLNSKILFQGKNEFSHGRWETRLFPVPDDLLRPGQNKISIRNLEKSGSAGGPPWFMIAEAVIAAEKYEIPRAPVRLLRNSQTRHRQIGMAKVDITPRNPVLLSGYAGRDHSLTNKVSGKLWARAICIGNDAESPVLLIAVDNCGVPAHLREMVVTELQEKFGLNPERITISSTHTHSGPMLRGVLESLTLKALTPDERDAVDSYTHELSDKLIEVANQALANRVSASLHFGNGETDFAINRRGATVTDHSVPVLVVADEQGTPIGIMTNYACHCVSGGNGSDISGDWAGCTAESIEALVPTATAVVLVGCAGDQNPASRGSFEVSKQLGQQLGEEVYRVLTTGLPAVNGDLNTDWKNIEIPFAEAPQREELEARLLQTGIEALRAEKLIQKLDAGERLDQDLRYPIQTWTFGHELAMVFLANEVVVDYSLKIKEQIDPARVWISAYSNDVSCYIPSERVLSEGGYEGRDAMAWYGQVGPFQSGIEKLILDEVFRQLGSLENWKHHSAKTGGTIPLSPAESIQRMTVADGFKVELVVSEPLVIDPVAFDFGTDGRLWVAEMRDYPEGVPGQSAGGSVIKSLEDTDGDGRYDSATVFLEGIPFVTGVTAWKNGVLVCTAPDVLYAEDTDGDGKADRVEKVLTGFATHNAQARVNSLSWGLDNWMYGAGGIFGGMLTAPQKENPEHHKTGSKTGNDSDHDSPHESAVDTKNRDFRFLPDTGRVEAVSGRTQQGRVRDDFGNWFGCTNSELLLHYPTTEHYYQRNQRVVVTNPAVSIVRDPKLYPPANLVQFELSGPAGLPTAVCGLGVYRDRLLGEDFSGNLFVCEPVNQIVHRRKLRSVNSTFQAFRSDDELDSEFLSSTDNWFRPVQVKTGPDGALWVVDMYRYVIEHPRFISDQVRSKLDVRAGDSRGRIYRVVRSDVPTEWAVPKISTQPTYEVIASLGSENGTLRDLAQMELLWRRDARVELESFHALLEHGSPAVRIQTLSVVDGLNILNAEVLKWRLDEETDPRVQRHLVRTAERFLQSEPDLVVQLLRLSSSSDPQLWLQLAYTLGGISPKKTVPVLLQLWRQAGQDEYLRSAILSGITAETAHEFLLEIATIDQDRVEIRALIMLAAEGADQRSIQLAIQPEINAFARNMDPEILNLLGRIHEIISRRKLQLPPDDRQQWNDFFDFCLEVATNGDSPNVPFSEMDPDVFMKLRLSAIKQLSQSPEPFTVIQRLEDMLAPAEPSILQVAAIQCLSEMNHEDSKKLVFDRLNQLLPSVKTAALEEIYLRPEWTRELLRRMQNSELSPNLVDLARRQTLLSSPVQEIRELSEKLFNSQSSSEINSKLQKLLASDLSGGESAAGQQVFEKHCSACHRSSGVGFAVGPDLDALTDQSKSFFLTSILNPNQAVDRRYATYVAALSDGRVLTGLLAHEGENSIAIKEKNDVVREILRVDLESLQDTGRSMMPEGLADEIPETDMQNLLAFLKATQTGAFKQGLAKPVDQSFESVVQMAKLLEGVEIGTADEYRKIPEIFGVAIAAARRDQDAELKAMLDFALPLTGEPLRDWEAVVIGGGAVNGLGLNGIWPSERIIEVIGEDESLMKRWQNSLSQSLEMSHSEQVPTGTRYDALRMVAMLGFEERFAETESTIVQYLAPGTNPELMQGAVCGLIDIPDPQAAVLVVESYPRQTEHIQNFSNIGLLRLHGETNFLMQAIGKGLVKPEAVPHQVRVQFLNHQNLSVREAALKYFE